MTESRIEILRRKLGEAKTQSSTSAPDAEASDQQAVPDVAKSKIANPLHPDPDEQLVRLTEELRVVKRQVYGGMNGEIGIAAHLLQVEAKVNELQAAHNSLKKEFDQFIELLGVQADA